MKFCKNQFGSNSNSNSNSVCVGGRAYREQVVSENKQNSIKYRDKKEKLTVRVQWREMKNQTSSMPTGQKIRRTKKIKSKNYKVTILFAFNSSASELFLFFSFLFCVAFSHSFENQLFSFWFVAFFSSVSIYFCTIFANCLRICIWSMSGSVWCVNMRLWLIFDILTAKLVMMWFMWYFLISRALAVAQTELQAFDKTIWPLDTLEFDCTHLTITQIRWHIFSLYKHTLLH